jgi:cytochrome c oxidase assembly protein subunit 15
MPAYTLAPLAWMACIGVLIALLPLASVALRHRRAAPGARLRALTLMTLFLTFDLVLFGAFTRLTDSGLGCPDWPGCYGNASPIGAREQIHAAQSALPSGPVTHGKAWVEMVHRYLATAVGVLITALALTSWIAARRRRDAVSPWWATVTLLWVCVQGAFGALTVTMKLYPAVVTAHLLGGIALLALLAAQSQVHLRTSLRLSRGQHATAVGVLLITIVQTALGGWVSTNYAVLACRDFPTCQGAWWPPMDFERGFTLLRGLGEADGGSYLPFAALTAIHMAHRIGALIVAAGLVALAMALLKSGDVPRRRFGLALAGVALWQLASGLGNVLLGWPLLAAVAHTGGAAALVALLTVLLMRAHHGAPLPSRSAPFGDVRSMTVAGS